MILPFSIFTTPPLPGSQERASHPRIWQYRLHRLRQSQGRPRPRLHPPPRYRWTSRIRRILTQTRSKAATTSKPPGQLSTRAEEKKLRRSNRKPNPNQSNPPAAKPTPPGPKKNTFGPKPASENPNHASNAAKLKHRREKRASKNAGKNHGANVPKQTQHHKASKK